MDVVEQFCLDTSDDMDTVNYFNSDSSDDMYSTDCGHSYTTKDMDTGNHADLGDRNDTGTGNHNSMDISKDVCTDNPVDSNIKKSELNLQLNEDSRKSSTAFTIDFGSDSSSGLSISDKLSLYLPKHVAQRVERRASNVKVRSERGKVVDKEGLMSRSQKSLPVLKGHRSQTRDETTGKPVKRKSLPIVNLRFVDTTHGQRTALTPTNKRPNEAKRTSLSSTIHSAPSYSNPSSFRTPCRKISCPLNQSSSRSAPTANNNYGFASPRSTDTNVSSYVDCSESKTGVKVERLGIVRSNHSYTILSSGKCEDTLDSISESGTYEVDEEQQQQREDIRKARRTISHVFGVRSSPKCDDAGKPKRSVQFTRSNITRQNPTEKSTTGSSIVRPGVRTGSSSADANKSRKRSPATAGQSVESKFGKTVETLSHCSLNNQWKRNSKATTLKTPDNFPGKDTRPNSHNASIAQSTKSRLGDFGVSTDDQVVNSGKGAVSCPMMLRPCPVVTLRTNRTFELRCAQLEASAAFARNADKASLLLMQKKRRRVPKLSADGTQETSSHTSICSRESGNSSVYGCRDLAGSLRGLRQSMRQSSCSLLQEEALSPVDSLASITIDGSLTSLDAAVQGKAGYVRKTSSLVAYQPPVGRERGESVSPISSKGLTFQDRFALDLPEVKAWHERHRNNLSKAIPPEKVLLENRKPVQQTTKAEQDKTNMLRNNIATMMNGNNWNALKMLLKMSEKITGELRKMNESHVRGVTTVPLAQQQAVTNAMISAFKNGLQIKKDVQEIRKLFKI